MVSIFTGDEALWGEAKHAIAGSNVIDTQSELASVASAAVVKPNVDTLYSRVIIDLSQNDLVLTVPNISDRFYIFPVRPSTMISGYICQDILKTLSLIFPDGWNDTDHANIGNNL